jgi:hypothetical protein
MTYRTFLRLFFAIAAGCAFTLSVCAQTSVPSTFKQITIDGSFSDWAGVPLAYTAADGPTNAIQYEDVYIANDANNLYIRFTLYAPRSDAFANSFDNVFIDADNNPATGFTVAGIGSEMLIQWGGGYQETNGSGGFNVGNINGLGWAIAGSADYTDFEASISLGATDATGGSPVFSGLGSTIAILLEGDNTSYTSVEFVPPAGGFVYTLATPPAPLTTNTPLIELTNSSWQVNASGTDLGTNWLGATYDDTTNGWISGDGLFGYTPFSGSYPPINTPLTAGPNTYYFITDFQWIADPTDVAFVVTNYLSDGAVFYVNGVEVNRIRMPAGAVSYATAATGTNSPVGQVDVFGIDGGLLQYGENTFEVETHQAPGSTAEMVFGLSLTAAIQYPVLIVNSNLPADQTVFAGQPATFSADILGSGPLSYQWFFDGTNAIDGATSSSYTIPLVLTNNAGYYSLLVSNAFNSVTTRTALLTVSNTPVSIVTQPANQVAVEGNPATFTVGVSGTPIIMYQWFFGAQPINGATNSTYTIASVSLTNSGSYQVQVSNPAGTSNSAAATLTVLADTIPPAITSILASAGQVTVTFSKPVDSATANNPADYSLSGGITVVGAVQNPNNAAQVVLTTGANLTFGTIYSLTVNGVKDLFGNAADTSGQFTRDITIDGSFDDWTGLAPVYTSAAPTGNTDAADYEAIYAYNDANYYYFRVTLWTDISTNAGEFPAYAELYLDTDTNINTGYDAGVIGSEVLMQSGFFYDERSGSFGGPAIDGVNWLCLPATPGTNFEFQISRSAVFDTDKTPVFTNNVFNFVFQGWTPSYTPENQAPSSGVLSYTNITPVAVPPLPLGQVAVASLSGGQAAIFWYPPGTLQYTTTLNGPWTNLPAAASPYVIPDTGGSEFFRLAQ